MRRAQLVLLLLLAVVVASPRLARPATAVAAAQPAVATKPATDITATSATLNATVDPAGSATTVHFEIGTDAKYGLESADKDLPAGSGPVAVAIPVRGLTNGVTYHVRVVATSDGGTAQGLDTTFTTTRTPGAPSVADTAARDISLTGATLVGSVTPHGSDTSYHFEYGRTTGYGTSTPTTAVGDGWDPVPASATIDGLEAGKTYHFRLVATSPSGTTRGGDHRLVVLSTPTAASLAASKYLVAYGSAVKLKGRLAGSKRAGVRVRLQTTTFPFDVPFGDVATATSSSKGSYRFTLPDLQGTTRALVIAQGLPDVVSPTITIQVAVRTGLAHVRTTAHRLIVTGTVTPATPNGTASLQRSSADGRWLPVVRRHLRTDGTYRISVRRWRRGGSVRVVGTPHDDGGHVSSASRTVSVPPLPPKHAHKHRRR